MKASTLIAISALLGVALTFKTQRALLRQDVNAADTSTATAATTTATATATSDDDDSYGKSWTDPEGNSYWSDGCDSTFDSFDGLYWQWADCSGDYEWEQASVDANGDWVDVNGYYYDAYYDFWEADYENYIGNYGNLSDSTGYQANWIWDYEHEEGVDNQGGAWYDDYYLGGWEKESEGYQYWYTYNEDGDVSWDNQGCQWSENFGWFSSSYESICINGSYFDYFLDDWYEDDDYDFLNWQFYEIDDNQRGESYEREFFADTNDLYWGDAFGIEDTKAGDWYGYGYELEWNDSTLEWDQYDFEEYWPNDCVGFWTDSYTAWAGYNYCEDTDDLSGVPQDRLDYLGDELTFNSGWFWWGQE